MSPWDAELRERGRTWNSEIAAARLPNTQLSHEGGGRGRERRFLGHGGLLINLRNGAWYSHSHQQGGYSPLGLLRFIDAQAQPDTPLADDHERIEWVLAFLANHPGEGPCNGTLEDGEGTAAEGASRIKAERVLRDLIRLDHPDAEPGRTYFASRQIPVPEPLPDWHVNTVGFLPHARVGEHAIVTLQRANQRIVSVNLRFIDALGEKSAVSPAFARYKLETGTTGVMEFPAAPGTILAETVIAEGLEDCLSVRRVCDQPIIGLVDVGVWRELAPITGQILIVRHGDAPGSTADKGLKAGIDRLTFSGRVRSEIRCTCPDPGEDANSLLQTEGEAALTKLLADARAGELAQPSYQAEVEYLATLDGKTFDSLRDEVCKRQKVQKKTLDRDVKAARSRNQQAPLSQADVLVALGNQAELFHTSDRKAYATVSLTDRCETFEIKSDTFEYWLRHEFYRATKAALPTKRR